MTLPNYNKKYSRDTVKNTNTLEKMTTLIKQKRKKVMEQMHTKSLKLVMVAIYVCIM